MGFVDDRLTRRAQSRFVRDVMRTPLLSREHESALAHAWRGDGDQKAKQELIEAYTRLVVSVASRFRNYGLPVEDLVQEGVIGLLQAAERFEPEREVRFSTYATWWIRAAIQDYVLRNWSIVRAGTTAAQKTLFFSLRRLRERIEKQSGRPLDDAGRQEIADQLSIDVRHVEKMEARFSAGDRSLNEPVGDDIESDLMSRLVDERPDPEQIVMGRRDGAGRSRWIEAALADLPEREQIIVRERRLTDEGATLEELGRRLGVSKERVRQLENRALSRLRTAILAHIERPGDLLLES